MPIGNINNNVRRVASAAIPRNLRAEDLQQVAKKVVRRGVYEEEARRKREEAQTAQGMAAVALATNPINQRMQNAQQENPARMSEQEVKKMLKQISARHYTVKNFNTSGLCGKLGAALEDPSVNVKFEALKTLGDIYFCNQQKLNESSLINILGNAIVDVKSEDIKRKVLYTFVSIYKGHPEEFNQCRSKEKLLDALGGINTNKSIRYLVADTFKSLRIYRNYKTFKLVVCSKR